MQHAYRLSSTRTLCTDQMSTERAGELHLDRRHYVRTALLPKFHHLIYCQRPKWSVHTREHGLRFAGARQGPLQAFVVPHRFVTWGHIRSTGDAEPASPKWQQGIVELRPRVSGMYGCKGDPVSLPLRECSTCPCTTCHWQGESKHTNGTFVPNTQLLMHDDFPNL